MIETSALSQAQGGKTIKIPTKPFLVAILHTMSVFFWKTGKIFGNSFWASNFFSQNGNVWCVDWWNRTEISIQCHKARGKSSKAQQNHFCTKPAHNISFPGKLEKFSEILFSENSSVCCVDL